MATSLLVVTPSPSFGELIRRPLEETGNYRVHVVNTKAAAIVRADEESCHMAFLDLDLGDTWVEEVGLSLRTVIPNVKLFILAGDETPSAFESIRPWTLIRKPLQLPDVLAIIAEPAATAGGSPAAGDNHDLLWLSDVNKAAQHLTRLTLESSSQAALITRDNALWAYAGQLSQDAAQEVARVLARNWDAAKGGDLLRFARLESTRAEHMLYATQLTEGMLLAMVFDAETPFSTIRSQAGQLATSLAEGEAPEPPEPLPAASATVQEEEPDAAAPTLSELEDDDDGMEMPPISAILRDIPAPDPRSATPAQILRDIPSPDPRLASAPVRLQTAAAPILAQKPAVQSNPTLTEPAPAESQPLPAPAPAQPVDPGQTRPSIFTRDASLPTRMQQAASSETTRPNAQSRPATPLSSADETIASHRQPRPETPVRLPQAGELDETRPQESRAEIVSSDLNVGSVTLEPISAGVYHLSYACLLLPRFASHFLTGDMADKLSEWIPIICVAFGWRLEHLAVRPEYLQWVVNVPPATSPGYVMRVIRQQLSDKVFAAFPRLKRDNPSGDFWAPGYLIMGGLQPHPPQLVKDYMRQIRQRQGADKLVTKAPKP